MVGDGQSYLSIQDAINASNNSDIIYVYNGTYYENLIVNKSIEIIGENKENTIIDGNFSGNAINIFENNTTINGFSIRNSNGTGIFSQDIRNITIVSCIIENNSYCGVLLNNSTDIKILYCDISGNYFGIFIDENSSLNYIYFNNFYYNTRNAQDDNHTNFWNYSNAGNFWDDFLYWEDSDSDGICDTAYEKFGVNDYYPLFHFYGSITNRNTDEIFLTIQEAIDDPDTVTGNVIFVLGDVYYENIVFSKSGITLLGEDKNYTFIDAGNQEMNAILIKNFGNNTIDGFTISNSPKTENTSSNGVLIWAFSDMPSNISANGNIITNCIIESNGAYGVLILASNSGQRTNSNIISNCEIFDNGYCGVRITNDFEIGGFSSSQNNTIFNCEFHNNGFDGMQDQTTAAVSISPNGMVENTTISDCIFYFSNGYDVHFEGNIVNNNTFYHNNFLSNFENVYDEGVNIWCNTNISEGNYWACYDEPSEGAINNDNNTYIIDNPYNVPGGNNQDLFPIATPLFNMTLPVAKTNGPYNAEVDEVILFDASGSYDLDGDILEYIWDLDNGNTIHGKTIDYAYSQPGEYTIIVTVTDEYGLKDVDITTAHITEAPEEEPQEEPENIHPIANAGGPYYEITGVEIQFDGSDSYDPDGTSLLFKWSFGDGNTSDLKMPTHDYLKEGNYTISLIVTDIHGATGNASTFAFITKKPNNPPYKPIIFGPNSTHINTTCNYTMNGSDPDNDTIKYIVNWCDGTNETESNFLSNGSTFNTSHSWSTGGIYIITIYTIDENNASSDVQLFKVLIDAYYCGSLGYLIDKNGDEIFDVFYRETTGKETYVEKNLDEYNIDINGDNHWDYTYNFTTNKIKNYESATVYIDTNNFSFETKWVLLIFVIVVFLVVAIIKIFIYRKQKNKQKFSKNNIKQDDFFINKVGIINPKSKEKKLEDIENIIDNLKTN